MAKQKSMGTSFEDDFDIEFSEEFDLDVGAELEQRRCQPVKSWPSRQRPR